MSVIETGTVTTIRHEYRVPAGSSPACWTDVLMAVRMAVRDYGQHHGNPEDHEPADDAIQVKPMDEEILVFWTEKLSPDSAPVIRARGLDHLTTCTQQGYHSVPDQCWPTHPQEKP